MASSVLRSFVLISLFVFLTGVSSTAQAQIGFAAGYGLPVLSSPSFSSSAQNTFEGTGGINVGMFYDFRFGKVDLRPGLFFRQGNFEWMSPSWKPEENPIPSTLRVAEIPIDVLYHIRMASFSPYVVAGPVFSFLHTDQQDVRISLDNPTGSTSFMGITLGAGIELNALGLLLFPEIRYTHALSAFLKQDYIVRSVPFATESGQRLSSLTVRLGIALSSYE